MQCSAVQRNATHSCQHESARYASDIINYSSHLFLHAVALFATLSEIHLCSVCPTLGMLSEIVADKQRGVVLRFNDGQVVRLPLCMDISATVTKLAHLTSSGQLLPQKHLQHVRPSSVTGQDVLVL